MFRPFICATFNPHQDDDGPRKPRNNKARKTDDKNPYSDRGLDKFSALLSELEQKKQKIYSQTGSQDVKLVRFKYKNSTDFVPIVVKLKDNKKEEEKKKGIDNTTTKEMNLDAQVIDKHPIHEGKEVMNKVPPGLQPVTDQKKKKQSFSWNIEFHKWRRPCYYLPTFLVLILLLLVLFERSVSILITCIGWYMVPIIQGKSYNKKKGYVRKLSDNKTGAVGDKSSQV
ncbi:hypothetical protein ERO13_D02G088600v2 [Gossypium hirsutum]|uniref:ZCF37 n=3 Tax=Gossypium TaxID=3633 RepID=A0A1U8JL51_GOSHI|nr:uncharacterized protein LOC107908344 [Gossypium hirsutum]KAG4157851.1 hypothetical protein ERO13_D02G088600v2 [Gossypium hirsutum]TYH83148.1 hypothetical protein ES332_D02G112500v1 [Gossypium tomentosum]TYI92962.1 hypothetical protein E1A91_D02G105600v1 [Gossypium mustelinum]